MMKKKIFAAVGMLLLVIGLCGAKSYMRQMKIRENEEVQKIEKQKEKLETEVDNIKRIRRAQYLLMEKLGMSENEAYKYIEKQSMDLCERKSDVAKRIIMTYEI